MRGTSLVVQRLRLCTPNAGGLGSIPGQGTRSHILQLRVRMPQLKILHAATKTQHSQIFFLKIMREKLHIESTVSVKLIFFQRWWGEVGRLLL